MKRLPFRILKHEISGKGGVVVERYVLQMPAEPTSIYYYPVKAYPQSEEDWRAGFECQPPADYEQRIRQHFKDAIVEEISVDYTECVVIVTVIVNVHSPEAEEQTESRAEKLKKAFTGTEQR